jgi:serine/threonine protein kinase
MLNIFSLYFQPPFYYPTCIGNILAQRYRIEHKLGHGGFSTVWMAHDIVSKRDVALKVTIPIRDAVDPESTMHNEIRQRVRDTSKLLLSCETFLRAHVLSFMLKGFSYNPQDRITAAQLLHDTSFQAVMGFYGA